MDSKKTLALILAMALSASLSGCGGGDDDDEIEAGGKAGGSSAAAAPAGTASLAGKVTLSGKAPKNEKIAMDTDAVCKSQHATTPYQETVSVDAKGNLKNVFVYVKEGAGKYPAPTSPVVLSQKGCQYTPHVFGVQAGQPIEIQNNDATLHNVHSLPTLNDPFNMPQPSQGMKTQKTFDKPEVLVKFKCDVHGWMNCWAGVVSNPFFAVTGDDGTFKISGLPAGSYTLVAVHEKFGESAPEKVEIKDGEAKSANFTFTVK